MPTKYELNHLLQIGNDWKSKILLVGESPALDGWILSGRAFYTQKDKLVPSGVRLNKLLSMFDLRLEDCSFTEICKCFVGKNRKLLKICGPKCWQIFVKQCELIKPKIIISLGVETLKIFNKCTDNNFGIGKVQKISIGEIHTNLLPIFHPSPINPKSQRLNEKIFLQNEKVLRSFFRL